MADPSGFIKRLQVLLWLESLALGNALERLWHAVGDGICKGDLGEIRRGLWSEADRTLLQIASSYYQAQVTEALEFLHTSSTHRCSSR